MACSGVDPLPTPNPDAGVVEPDPDVIGDPEQLIVETLSPETPAFAHSTSDVVLATFSDRVLEIRTATSAPVAGEFGELVGVGRWSGGVLAAATDGFYVLENNELRRSPLTDALDGLRPFGLMSEARVDGAALWIAGEQGLARWADGQVRTFATGNLPSARCQMAHGAPIDGAAAVWVACEGTLYGLVGANEAWQAHEQAQVADVRSLAVDGAQTLWIVSGDGSVWSRDVSGAWRARDFASDAVRVSGSPTEGGDLWIETMSGLWRHDEGVFHRIESPAITRLYGAAGPGRALVASAQGFLRVHADLRVDLAGLEDGGLLEDVTEVSIVPLLASEVTSVTATLDDVAINVDGQGPWSVTLDPEQIADGSHILSVTVDYASGTSVTENLRFSWFVGPPPTWADDVQPIFEDRCALCHGAQASARRLDTSERWQEQIDLILENVRTGRMPLPPVEALTEAQRERIEGWVAAGFPGGE